MEKAFILELHQREKGTCVACVAQSPRLTLCMHAGKGARAATAMSDVLRKTQQDAASARRMEEDLEDRAEREETTEDIAVKARKMAQEPLSKAGNRNNAPIALAPPSSSVLEDAISRMGTDFAASKATDDSAIIFDT